MSRNQLVLVIAVLGLSFTAWSVSTFRDWVHEQPSELQCADFLKAPRAGWFKVHDCGLDVDAMVLESANGEFEPLANRRKGLWSKLYDTPPQWVAAVIPLVTPLDRGARRAALHSTNDDLLKWVNALEAADDARRERMWAEPTVLLRMSRPALLEGHAEKPEGDVVPRAFGPQASVNMHFLTLGKAPEQVHPSLKIAAGAVLLMALIALLLRFGKPSRLQTSEETAEQVTARNIVGSTRVELGELEQLRAEEERERRKRGS